MTETAPLSQFVAMFLSVIKSIARQDDLCTKAPGVGHFNSRCKARHHDHGRHAHALSVIGYTLGMIACGYGDHSLCTLGGRKHQHTIHGPSFFERGGELQVFKLQPDSRTQDIGQSAGVREWRLQYLPTQVLTRR